MSDVTVIMGVRNGGHLLVPAVRSILSQVGVDLQLFVMDDGSTDGTAGLLASLAAADSRLTVYTQENQGLGRSLNTLCARTTSPFVARMDADDLSLPWRLQEQVAYLQKRPEIGAVGCWTMTAIDEWHRGGCACYPDDDAWIKARLRDGQNVLVHSSMVMRRSVLGAMPEPYRFRYVQDYDLWLRLAEITAFGMVTRVSHVTRLHDERVSARQLAVRRLLHAAIRDLAEERRAFGAESRTAADIEATAFAGRHRRGTIQVDEAWNRAILALHRRDLRDARRFLLRVCWQNRTMARKAARWLVLASMPRGERWLERFSPLYRYWQPLEKVATPEQRGEIAGILATLAGSDVGKAGQGGARWR